MAHRRFALGAAAGCGLLLAACTATPTYPMLTPIQVAKDFGYFDQPVDETHWIVSYVTPQQTGYGFRFDQSPAESQAKGLATDMALWHASQVAQAHGYAGFTVTDKRYSTDAVNVEDLYYDDPYWGGGWGGPWGGPWGGWGGGWGWGGPWGGPGFYDPPQSKLQVEAKLNITLTRSPKGDDYRAEDTINRLRTTYPGAEGVPAVAPAGAAPAATPPAAPASPRPTA